MVSPHKNQRTCVILLISQLINNVANNKSENKEKIPEMLQMREREAERENRNEKCQNFWFTDDFEDKWCKWKMTSLLKAITNIIAISNTYNAKIDHFLLFEESICHRNESILFEN